VVRARIIATRRLRGRRTFRMLVSIKSNNDQALLRRSLGHLETPRRIVGNFNNKYSNSAIGSIPHRFQEQAFCSLISTA
jgi:hypothetical protein